ncbi:hypothetical protein V8G54_020397 [Vigna mungo]|uniref:PB1-like domain-containing protein n=1 Tax=Vigna mungo TaxID=3915 RepID=A0AAQ3RWN3_VIGMU
MDDAIDCVFHHGGKFVNYGTLKYEGDTTTLSFDLDMWSYFVVVSVVKSFGYDNFKQLWYCVGGGLVLENTLEELIDDTGAMHMANLARLNGEVHLYVVHVVSEPEVIHMLEYVTNDEREVEGHGEVQEEGEEDGDEVDGEVDGDLEDGDGVEVDGNLEEVHEGQEDGDVVEVEIEGHGHVQELHQVEEDVHGVEVEVQVEGHGDGDEEQKLDVCEGVVEDEVDVCSWSTSSDEGHVHGNNECLEGLVNVSVECDIDGNIDGNVEVEVESLKDNDDVSVECDHCDDRCLSNEEWKSEELLTATDNDEEVNDSEGYGRTLWVHAVTVTVAQPTTTRMIPCFVEIIPVEEDETGDEPERGVVFDEKKTEKIDTMIGDGEIVSEEGESTVSPNKAPLLDLAL